MSLERGTRHRRSMRLKGYHYSQCGAYFVTICTSKREPLFGDVDEALVRHSEMGMIAQTYWTAITDHFECVELDAFVVMPNHIHGVFVISSRGGVTPPLPSPVFPHLGAVIGFYKYGTTKAINSIRRTPGALVWQRGYYDHVIRDQKELAAIREYIAQNPGNWRSDRENPGVGWFK